MSCFTARQLVKFYVQAEEPEEERRVPCESACRRPQVKKTGGGQRAGADKEEGAIPSRGGAQMTLTTDGYY